MVGRVLMYFGKGGVDTEPARVGLVLIGVINGLANHFSKVISSGENFLDVSRNDYGLGPGPLELVFVYVPHLGHSPQNVWLAIFSPVLVDDGVVGRGSF